MLLFIFLGVLAYGGAHFGAGKGAINMDDVQCTGNEAYLTECAFHENSDCTHNEDAGVICGLIQGNYNSNNNVMIIIISKLIIIIIRDDAKFPILFIIQK